MRGITGRYILALIYAMDIFTFNIAFLISLVAQAIATIPPSASNLAAVKYNSDKNLTKALHLAYGAALGEVIITGLALSFGVWAKQTFKKLGWIQVFIVALLAIAGVYFIYKKSQDDSTSSSSKPQRFINGFLFGALNIPMFM